MNTFLSIPRPSWLVAALLALGIVAALVWMPSGFGQVVALVTLGIGLVAALVAASMEVQRARTLRLTLATPSAEDAIDAHARVHRALEPVARIHDLTRRGEQIHAHFTTTLSPGRVRRVLGRALGGTPLGPLVASAPPVDDADFVQISGRAAPGATVHVQGSDAPVSADRAGYFVVTVPVKAVADRPAGKLQAWWERDNVRATFWVTV